MRVLFFNGIIVGSKKISEIPFFFIGISGTVLNDKKVPEPNALVYIDEKLVALDKDANFNAFLDTGIHFVKVLIDHRS